MAPHIEIVDGQVIATPKQILDFVAVVSWKGGEVHLSFAATGKQPLSPKNLFHLWIGITSLMLEQDIPPRIEKILIDALQSLKPEFTYESKIERGGQKKS